MPFTFQGRSSVSWRRRTFRAPHCSFITTTPPPTRVWKPQSLWLTTTWLSFPILPTHRT
jgi:hypothetical protein